MVGPQIWSRRFGDNKNLLPLCRIQTLDHATHSLVTIKTKLSWLLSGVTKQFNLNLRKGSYDQPLNGKPHVLNGITLQYLRFHCWVITAQSYITLVALKYLGHEECLGHSYFYRVTRCRAITLLNQITPINCVPVLPCWVTWGNTDKILLTCVTIETAALLEDRLNLTLEVVAGHTLKK